MRREALLAVPSHESRVTGHAPLSRELGVFSCTLMVVGGIIGWNMFTGSPTDPASLSRIVSTWLIGPILAAGFAFVLHTLVAMVLRNTRFHMLHIDAWTRTGLMIGAATAAYMLGANNIANVMGMFVPASPFADLTLLRMVRISGTEQLFFIGGAAIAVGAYTYGERVMATVGKDLYKITPLSGLVVVAVESVVLFLFTSQSLERVLVNAGLPSFPLVPLSSTQVVIGAVIGVGLAKGGRGINYSVLLKIGAGWVIAPVVACIIAFILLFFVQNVFEQNVVRLTPYAVTADVLQQAGRDGIDTTALSDLAGTQYAGSSAFRKTLESRRTWTEQELVVLFACARLDSIVVDTLRVDSRLAEDFLSPSQRSALVKYQGSIVPHRWQFEQALAQASPEWTPLPGSEPAAQHRREQKAVLYDLFRKH
ncbi:Sulfate permease CysP [Anaerolineae bacterium]|nr:Sulfate permease CysP [Anaerolineae bacterium]